MNYQFGKHYTREEARALLPQIQQWLRQISDARARLATSEQCVAGLLSGGKDIGGETVNQAVRIAGEIKGTLVEFQRRQIQIKDLDRGLIDFPAVIGGKEVFLCWEQGEEDIEFWHALDAGYAGRERLQG